MSILVVLADDLTGALDTGVQFAKNGIATRVLLHPASRVSEQTQAEVLVINTATRHCPPDEARRVIAACVERYQDVPYIYKKTDSTLRGNIGAELEALMNARNSAALANAAFTDAPFTNAPLPFIPAYPDLGRTTLNGQHFINGVPLHQTETARDALNPVLHSFIPDIIGMTSNSSVSLVPFGGTPQPARPCRKATTPGRDIMVFDCQTNEELSAIANSLWDKDLLHISAGCAGFAACLVDILPFSRQQQSVCGASITQTPSVEAALEQEQHRPILVLSGSRHPVSVEQVKAALESGITGIAVPAEKLGRPEWLISEEAALLAGRCAAALMKDGACVMGTKLALGQEDARQNTAPDSQDTRAQLAAQTETAGIAGHLGALVKKVIAEIGPVHLVIFGGDTLLGVMEHLGVDSIVPLREITAGVVLARTEVLHENSGDDATSGNVAARDSLTLVTKAGAFGDLGVCLFRSQPPHEGD